VGGDLVHGLFPVLDHFGVDGHCVLVVATALLLRAGFFEGSVDFVIEVAAPLAGLVHDGMLFGGSCAYQCPDA
jgi:hypothetical protein